MRDMTEPNTNVPLFHYSSWMSVSQFRYLFSKFTGKFVSRSTFEYVSFNPLIMFFFSTTSAMAKKQIPVVIDGNDHDDGIATS